MNSKNNKSKMKENTTRVILNLPNEIDKEYKELSSKRGITKSSMIIYSMSWFLDYCKTMDLMPKIIETLKSVNV